MTPPNHHPDHPAMSEQVRGSVAEVLAIAPDTTTADYLTAGKAYEVLQDNGFIFWIEGDDGDGLCCSWLCCAHLNGWDWTRSAAAAARAQVQA